MPRIPTSKRITVPYAEKDYDRARYDLASVRYRMELQERAAMGSGNRALNFTEAYSHLGRRLQQAADRLAAAERDQGIAAWTAAARRRSKPVVAPRGRRRK